MNTSTANYNKAKFMKLLRKNSEGWGGYTESEGGVYLKFLQ